MINGLWVILLAGEERLCSRKDPVDDISYDDDTLVMISSSRDMLIFRGSVDTEPASFSRGEVTGEITGDDMGEIMGDVVGEADGEMVSFPTCGGDTADG